MISEKKKKKNTQARETVNFHRAIWVDTLIKQLQKYHLIIKN